MRVCREAKCTSQRSVVESSIGAVPGKGVFGIVQRKSDAKRMGLCVGSRAHLDERGVSDLEIADAAARRDDTVPVYVALDGVVQCVFLIGDELRPGIRDLMPRLRCRIAILSGDRSPRPERVARDLGVDEYLSCLPHEKATRIKEWQREGEIVAMVGDGINDLAALAAADVGISVGSSALLADGRRRFFLPRHLQPPPSMRSASRGL